MNGKDYLFNKRRYRMLFLSIFVIALGFIIMSEVKQVILIFLMMKYITSDVLDLHP
ncbi:MAG: hypothetical protein CM15mP102_18740 [Flavobacteriales bacterium]|nr:MAG: hypothetical protein CM15mP102_18740 [Flavobacteriales bacterium]